MDFEKEKRRQTIKVIVAESLMVLSVVTLVIFLVLVVSGYWINADFEVERSGLLQVSSVPTGATVTVDGDTWFQRTNTSKILPSGSHTVTVTKDGYDTWTKDIEISDGLLYRLHYPRLFLIKRKKELALPMTDLVKVAVSPKQDELLVYQTDGWGRINLNNEVLSFKTMTSAEATILLQDWNESLAEAESYDEEGNILLKFYEDKYIVKIAEDTINVTKKDNEERVLSEKLPFVPETIKVGHRGEFIIMGNGCEMVTLNMETMNLISWTIENKEFTWFDSDMIYIVSAEGNLIVYDYDGLNRREVTNGVLKQWPVTIVGDKWLYYFSEDGLMREWLIPHNV